GLAAFVDLDLADVGVQEPDCADPDLVPRLHRRLVRLVDLVAERGHHSPSSLVVGVLSGFSGVSPFSGGAPAGRASAAPCGGGAEGGPSASVASSSCATTIASTTLSDSLRPMTRSPMLARPISRTSAVGVRTTMPCSEIMLRSSSPLENFAATTSPFLSRPLTLTTPWPPRPWMGYSFIGL